MQAKDSDFDSQHHPLAEKEHIIMHVASKPNKTTSKRTEPIAETPNKKMKMEGSSCAQRLWSEHDEVAILKGIFKYKTKKGTYPFENMADFHVFIEKYITVDVTLKQLKDKVRRLKNKFNTNVKTMNKGDDIVLYNPHECKCFKLSKKIWGCDEDVKAVHVVMKELGNGDVKSDEVEDKLNDDDLSNDLLSGYPYLNASLKWFPGFENEFLKDGVRLIGASKLKVLEEKWRRLNEEELKLHIKRIELIREQSKVILDAMRSSMT